MTFYIGGTPTSSGLKCRIEFQHLHTGTRYGKKKLRTHPSLRGITTCVLVYDNIVSVGHTICSHLDNFCKEAGRGKALKTALKHKLIPWAHRVEIQKYYDNRPRLSYEEQHADKSPNGDTHSGRA